MGIGPQIAYDPGVQTTLLDGLRDPRGLALDGRGNLYIAEFGANRIVKATPAGETSIYAKLTEPGSLALDGLGNLFATWNEGGSQQLSEIAAGGAMHHLLAEGSPVGLTIDGSGDVFEADAANDLVVRIVGSSPPYSIGASFTPGAIVIDRAGNIYVVDRDEWLIWKVTPAGAWRTIGEGFNRPEGIAVDQAGNLYVADFGNNRVVKVSPSGIQTTVGTGLVLPTAVTLDAAGNVYISDFGNGRVVKVTRSAQPPLVFATTTVGKTSSDSPQAVDVENIGTAGLAFPVPHSGKNPSLSTNFVLSNLTTCPALGPASNARTLAAGAECSYEILFRPKVTGAIDGALVMNDNDLNAVKRRQTIPLRGKGKAVTSNFSGPPPAPVPVTTN